jgi:hypothetical protein
MTQWHPIFAQLLRPAVEEYYEVQTTVPVGDAPREADFVLVRRARSEPPPFRGVWRNLTTWNVMEFKGPSVSPRSTDVELLVELGLGIERHLQTRRVQEGHRRLGAPEVSFWYIANHLGMRFLCELERKLGTLETQGSGLWCCKVLGRLLFWVSSIDLPVEVDSLPLHLVGQEPLATERQVARLVLEEQKLQKRYGGWLATLHPEAWKEVEAMARTAGKKLKLDLQPAIDYLGLDRVIDQIGLDRLIDHVGENELIKRIGMERWLAHLSPAERRELKRRLQ